MGTEPKYKRQNPNIKIELYAAQLIKVPETDARRPKRSLRTALKLFGKQARTLYTLDRAYVNCPLNVLSLR